MEGLYYLLGIIAFVVIVITLYIKSKGDANIEFKVAERTALEVVANNNSEVVFSCKIPYINTGKQCGTIMDCFSRHYLPKEQFDKVKVKTQIELLSSPRDDDYFEAVLAQAGAGDTLNLKVSFSVTSGDIKSVLQEMVDMPIDVFYQIVARKEWFINKKRIEIKAEEIRLALQIAEDMRGA